MSLQHADRVFDLIGRHKDLKVLEVLFEHVVANQPLLGFSYGRGSIFWRGRLCHSPNGFDSVSEVIYPPASCTPVNRLNDPGDPMFYAATRDFTVLAELQPNEGDYVHLVGVRIRPNVGVHLMAIGELFHVYKAGFSRVAPGGGPSGEISRELNKMGFAFGTRVIYADVFLSNILADRAAKQNEYVQSRALRSAVFKKVKHAEGFFYPSIVDHIGTNLVVRPRTFDIKFDITSSRVIRIDKRRRFGFYDTTTMRNACGVAIDGAFEWLPSSDMHERIIFNMSPEEEKFCRENQGEITPETYSEFISLAGMPDLSQ